MENKMMQRSIGLGSFIGTVAGACLGAGAGAISMSWAGAINGAITGVILGLIIGVATGWLTVRTGGTTGGVSVGAYSGMGMGAFLGGVFGAFIPDSVRLAANTTHTPIMDTLTASTFETAFLICFLGAIAGTAAGAWVGGKNLISRNTSDKK